MKINELLLESTPFTEIKRLNTEFKEIAAECDLTIVAGMGWPAIGKDGGWFGGGLRQKGGNRKAEDALSLPIKHRITGFLQMLAKKLEALMAEGRIIKVAPAAERSKSIIDVAPGEALEKLSAALKLAKPPGNVTDESPAPCVAWFVGNDEKWTGKSTFRLSMGFSPPTKDDKTSFIEVGGALDTKIAKKLEKSVKQFQNVTLRAEWADGARKPLPRENLAKLVAIQDDLVSFLKTINVALPWKPSHDGFYLDASLKVLAKRTKVLDDGQMTRLLAILDRHL